MSGPLLWVKRGNQGKSGSVHEVVDLTWGLADTPGKGLSGKTPSVDPANSRSGEQNSLSAPVGAERPVLK